MSGSVEGGIDVVLGKLRSGKTSFALHLAFELFKLWWPRFQSPILIMDMGAASNFAHLPHASGPEEVCEDLFVKRVSPKIWTPRREEERADFWALAEYFGGFICVIDEIRKLCKPQYVESGFANAITMHGHGKFGPSRYILTGARPKYIHSDLWPAFEDIYIFCLAKGRDAKVIEEHLEYPPSVTTNLGRGEYVEYHAGFPVEETREADEPGEGESGDAADSSPGADPDPATVGESVSDTHVIDPQRAGEPPTSGMAGPGENPLEGGKA